MSKVSRKAAAAVIAVGLMATTVLTNIKADEIYDDTSVGISSALERYVESMQETDTAAAADVETVEAVPAAQTDESKPVQEAKVAGAEKELDTEEASEEEKTEETGCRYPQFEGRCLTTATSYVNIRSEANEDSEIVGTLAANGIALVKEKGDTWTKIASGSCEGYIRNDFLVYGDDAGAYAESHCGKIATITTETLNVRLEPSQDSDCVTMVPGGLSYPILEETDGWVKIQVDSQMSGYINTDYADISFDVVRAVSVAEAEAMRQAEEAAKQQEQESSSNSSGSSSGNTDSGSASTSGSSGSGSSGSQSTTPPPSSGDTGVDLANYALQFVGNPYVYGGTSLTNGTDCSGFTMLIYAQYGISLPHSATAQSSYGTSIDISDREPGDLIFYHPDGMGGYDHVALYVGNDTVVHASTASTGIKTSAYNYSTPQKIVRLLGQ